MRKIFTATAFVLGQVLSGMAQVESESPFVIYSADGEVILPSQAPALLGQADVVLFGEVHNHPLDHWLQLEWVMDLSEHRNVVLGAEMFERDDQVIIDEFLQGLISMKDVVTYAYTWPNFETDYEPLLQWAQSDSVAFIATNVPRRYASMVAKRGKEGLSQLPPGSRRFLPPLPFEVTAQDTGYSMMRSMMTGHGHGGHGGMNPEYMVEAQALKDYTMASSILEHWEPGQLFGHFNGTFHSNYHSGIVGYLRQLNPEIAVKVIASVEAEELSWDESWSELGDIIIVCTTNMTKTH